MQREVALDAATARTRARYDRLARVYDRMEARIETRRFGRWRALLWSRVQGERVLEIGVGTGKNLAYHPSGARVTAIDLSPKMLERAEQEAARLDSSVTLQLADAQALPFPDASFDTVVATFVFCSVPDPVLGLRETRRVLKPDGQLLLLEHMLSANRLLRLMMRAINPVVVRLMGANINRETLRNVERVDFRVHQVESLMGDIVKLIEARRPAAESLELRSTPPE
jgi:phosphatidylethanolamine/phosphatidyl-N-methylethanolamine N-methyltransferase